MKRIIFIVTCALSLLLMIPFETMITEHLRFETPQEAVQFKYPILENEVISYQDQTIVFYSIDNQESLYFSLISKDQSGYKYLQPYYHEDIHNLLNDDSELYRDYGLHYFERLDDNHYYLLFLTDRINPTFLMQDSEHHLLSKQNIDLNGYKLTVWLITYDKLPDNYYVQITNQKLVTIHP